MGTLLTLLVVFLAAGLGIKLVQKLIREEHSLTGIVPFLAIIGLLLSVLLIDTSGRIFLGLAVFTATLCATIWMWHWWELEQESITTRKAFTSKGRGLDYRFGPHDDPFARRESTAFANGDISSSGDRKPGFIRTAPGIRRTSTGAIIGLKVSNQDPDRNKEHRRAKLKLVQ